MANGTIAQAVALRKKYVVTGPDNKAKTLKLPLDLLGVSPFNRQGCYPSLARVQGLMCDLLLKGISVAEANHEGVVVEEVPPEHWAAFQEKYKKPYESLRDFNVSKTKSVKALEVVFAVAGAFQHGTLSHSHLCVGLLCLKNGAQWDLFPEHKNQGLEALQTGPGGAWNKAALCDFSPALAELFRDGISVEVLSWKIFLEEPGGAELISAALNDPQTQGLHIHEMEALNCLVNVVYEEHARSAVSGHAGCVSYPQVLAQCKKTMPGVVAQAQFKDMFEFVINIGGKTAGFVQRLFKYERRFVDHKKRRLPPQAWGCVNSLAPMLPRTKVALLMRAYSKDPAKGFCPAPETMWHRVPPHHLEALEELLTYFQHTLGSAVADLGTEPAEMLLANVALHATEAWFRNWTTTMAVAKLKTAMLEATKEFYDDVLAKQQALHRSRGEEGNCNLPLAKQDWIDFARVKKEEATAKEKPIMPVVLQFNADGQPINAQMESSRSTFYRSRGDAVLELPVQQWHRSVTARGLDMERTHQAAIAMVMQSWHQSDSTTAVPLQMQYDVDTNKCIVVATKHIDVSALELLLCCPSAKQFPKISNNPSAVLINVSQERPTQDTQPSVYYANPEFKLPTIKVAKASAAVDVPEDGDASAVAEASTADQTYQFNFGGTESIHFYWGLQRMTADELRVKGTEKGCEGWRFNLTTKMKYYRVIVPGGSQSPTISLVTMPTIVNTVPLNKGDRLILEIVKQVKQKNEPSRKVAWQLEKTDHTPNKHKKAKVSASSDTAEVL